MNLAELPLFDIRAAASALVNGAPSLLGLLPKEPCVVKPGTPTYLGKLCKSGHPAPGAPEQSVRYAATRQCTLCANAATFAWIKLNRERNREIARKSYWRCHDKRQKNQKEYRRSPQGMHAGRKYRQEHREEGNARSRAWIKTPKGRIRSKITSARRRELNPLEARHHLTFEEINSRYELFGGSCTYCSNQATTLDHFIPISAGGKTALHNLLPACKSCNCRKNNSSGFGWFQKQPTYSKERVEEILDAIRPYLRSMK